MRAARLWWAVHNCIAHPLMVLVPALGDRLHAFTAERAEAAERKAGAR